MKNERLLLNLMILEHLEKYLIKNPDQRFCQALRNIGIVDSVSAVPHEQRKKAIGELEVLFSNEFYTESKDTLAKILDRLEEEEIQK